MTTTTAPNPKHPAPYSKQIVPVLDSLVMAEYKRLGRPIRVLDPFAGIGRIHQIARPGKVKTVGIEIQPGWAACHEDTICADSLAWMEERRHHWRYARQRGDAHGPGLFDVVVTSPAYGNRFADHHDARDGSTRRSYAHDLRSAGEEPVEGSSATMAWGRAYWLFHARAYRAIAGMLRQPNYDDDLGGLFLLNVSDFIRGKQLVPAVMWHRGACHGAGMAEDKPPRLIETDRMGYGENRDARAPSEIVMRLRLQDRLPCRAAASGASGEDR